MSYNYRVKFIDDFIDICPECKSKLYQVDISLRGKGLDKKGLSCERCELLFLLKELNIIN